MSTLLLRLAAPMQSWGTDSKFDIRKTAREPSKSGVIGLLAAALGRRRDEPNDDLSQMRFGVRVDREGSLLKDFHMVRGESSSYVTTRYYLADAVFLVGIEATDEGFLEKLDTALKAPAYPLYLGRRACPPTLPLTLGIRKEELRTALMQEPLLIVKNGRCTSLRLLYDDDRSGNIAGRVHDVPISFNPANRCYGWRTVCTETMYVGEAEHDPMEELR